jgi:methionyl-tRNA formyltransferase
MVAASNRPQYHDALRALAASNALAFSVQPPWRSAAYAGFVEWVRERAPDLIWVNSYSLIVRPDVLSIPRLGGINVHGGLLPQYRGSNPLQWAILNGETTTGVTIHEMTDGIDEGPILARREVALRFEDTWRNAQTRIAGATDRLLAEIAPDIVAGRWQSRPQDESLARSCPRRTPEDGVFRLDEPVRHIYNLIRALVAPHPGAFHLVSNGTKVVIDHYLTPAEVAQLKYGDGVRRIEAQGLRLRPLADAPPRTDRLPFVVEEAASGVPLGRAWIADIDWAASNASLVHYEVPAPMVDALFTRLAAFARDELGLRDLRAAGAQPAEKLAAR